MSLIALFTDFGLDGPYTGQMKAVLAAQAPGVPVVDVFPDLPPFDIRAAAYLLPAYCAHLPATTVCVCVVDPGVGGDRRGLIVEAAGRLFVGPDNGLFSLLIRRTPEVKVHAIQWHPETPLSATFHGRDWFAPLAARLARGDALGTVATPIATPVLPDWPEDLAEVLYVDRYGNAITGLRAATLPADSCLIVRDRSLPRARTYSDRKAGDCFWYENSNGLVELAANRASIADRLRLRAGEPVQVPR